MIFNYKTSNHIYLLNGKVYYQRKIQNLDLEIKNSKIVQISHKINRFHPSADILDCKNYLISPSFFDAHVHTRNPGFEEKETIQTFEVSALMGGFLDVLAMGNVKPRPSNLENFKTVEKILKTTKIISIHSVASVTEWVNSKQRLVNFKDLSKFTNLFSDDGAPVLNNELMEEALIKAKENNCSVLVHEEYRTNNGVVYFCDFAIKNNIPYLKQEYESKLIKRDIELNRKINAHLHIQHISTPQSVQYISQAKQQGVFITCEVTPHHLCLNNEMIQANDGNFRMNPPLPLKSWQKFLINKFKKGVIDIIVTDHALHREQEKNDLLSAQFGIIGSEFCFPLLYTFLVKTKKVSLPLILEKLTTTPAALIFSKQHYIEIGMPAKIVIIDLGYTKTITKENICSKSKNTPLLNKKLSAWPKYLIKQNLLIKLF